MKTFSVAEQSVTEPHTGLTLRFSVDSDDTSKVYLDILNFAGDAPNDYARLTFRRGGHVDGLPVLYDYAAEENTRERKLAESRMLHAGLTDDQKKENDDRKAKQIEDDKALLAAEPVKSKYEDENPAGTPAGRILDPNDPRFSYVGAADPGSRQTGVADPDIERTLRPLDAVRAVEKAQQAQGGAQRPRTAAEQAEYERQQRGNVNTTQTFAQSQGFPNG